MIGRACLIPMNGPLTFTAIMASKDSIVHFLDVLPDVDARVVHQDIEASGLLKHGGERSLPAFLRGHVEEEEDRSNRRGRLFPLRTIRVGHEHRGAFLLKPPGDLRADSSRSAGNQSGLARKTHRAHFAPPLRTLTAASFS